MTFSFVFGLRPILLFFFLILKLPKLCIFTNPLFFKPDEHMKHHGNHAKTEIGFLMHMIPHHQVAIDMSRRLLLHSNNPLLRGICNKIIRDQEGEIAQMKYMLQNRKGWQNLQSSLLANDSLMVSRMGSSEATDAALEN